jgi:hypothetical protein
VVKLFKWVVPLIATTLLVVPLIQPTYTGEDNVGIGFSQAPSRSALKSNRYTQIEPDSFPVVANPFATIEGYTYRATYEGYAFYDQASDASFRVVEVATGYVWASSVDYDYFLQPDSPLADPDDLGLNLFWQNKLRSPFFLTYYQNLNLREEHAFENVRSTLTMTRTSFTNGVGFDVDVSLFLSKINFSFSVMFNAQGLHVDLPFASIEEVGDFKLSTISLYPMLGATKRLRTPGYVVIPDGVGALIRYTDNPDIGVYTKRFYGSDEGLNAFTRDQALFANMYGLVHGRKSHAMLAIITDGAAHGIFNHFGSQVFLDFNFSYVAFNYRTTYLQYLNQAKTSSVNLLQAQATPIDIGLTYQFLHDDEADYVGIANRFADWRFDQEPSIPSPNAVPLHVDVLALESKPGLFAREKVLMTTMDDLVEIVKDLRAKVTDALFMNYVGWQQGGYSYTAPQYQRVDSILNDLGLWTAYQQSLEETNTTLHFAADPYRAYIHGRGYQTSDIIQSIGLEFLAHRDYFQLNTAAGQRIVNDLRALLNEWSIQGLSLETIGHRASSDFASQGLSKEAMIRAVADTIQETDAIDRPMSYAWHAKYLLDLPMYSSEQARFTDTVPLIPYMIAQDRIGFGRAGNFFSNTTNELLRMVDYGLYPAFFVTEASAYELIDTGSEHIFTSRYKDWQPEIKRQYDFIADALVHVLGQRIVARDVMALGVVAITYENLVRVVVNYTGEVYQQNGLNVQPMSYEVIVESLT